jgi:hypothetical protein
MSRLNVSLNQDDDHLVPVAINIASGGDNVIIAGVAGQVIRIFKIFFITAAAVNVTFKDGAGNLLTGAMPFVANMGMVLDFDTKAWVTTTLGSSFIINLSSGVQISGALQYDQR